MSGTTLHLDPIRCPYCVQGYEFRVMTDLTAGLGENFYCPACRHLVRTAEPDFQCFCRGCTNLRRPAGVQARVASKEERRIPADVGGLRKGVPRSTVG